MDKLKKGLSLLSNGSYQLSINIENQRYRKQFSADSISDANKYLDKFKADRLRQLNIVGDVNSTVEDYWKTLCSLRTWSKKVRSNYTGYYNTHLSYLSDVKITDIKPSHFTSLNIRLKDYSLRSQKKAYEILKPLFDLAVEDEVIDKSPIKKSHIPKRNQLQEKKIITNAEYKYIRIYDALFTLFDKDQVWFDHTNREEISAFAKGEHHKNHIQCSKNPNHLAFFLFGFHGRRLMETYELRWDDIDFLFGTYVVRKETNKVNVDMEFTLPDDIKAVLERLYEDRQAVNMAKPEDRVFYTKYIEKWYKKISKVSGVEGFTFHWMRNLAVSALAAKGVDATHLSAMLGHTDTNTLKQYLSLQRNAATAITNQVSVKLLDQMLSPEDPDTRISFFESIGYKPK